MTDKPTQREASKTAKGNLLAATQKRARHDFAYANDLTYRRENFVETEDELSAEVLVQRVELALMTRQVPMMPLYVLSAHKGVKRAGVITPIAAAH